MSYGVVIRIQKEITRLSNDQGASSKWWELIRFVNRLSPYEVVEDSPTAAIVMRHKKTKKEIIDGV